MLLAPATVISLLYSYSYLGNKKLREIPFLKIFFISLIWAYTTVFIPLGGSGIIQYSSLILMFFQRFFFIFAITIPFDIRDIEKDRRSNLKTIPTEKGAGFSKVLAIVALFLSLILWMINKKGTGNVFHSLVPFLFSAIYAGVLIILSKPQRKTFYYTFLVDGALVIQALMVFLLY